MPATTIHPAHAFGRKSSDGRWTPLKTLDDGTLVTSGAGGGGGGDASEATLVQVRDNVADVETILGGRYSGTKLAATATVTNSGDTIVISAPGVGLALKVFWVYAINDPDQATNPLITFKWSGGIELYRAYAVAHWEPFVGPVNTAFVCNLDSVGSVATTVHYQVV